MARATFVPATMAVQLSSVLLLLLIVLVVVVVLLLLVVLLVVGGSHDGVFAQVRRLAGRLNVAVLMALFAVHHAPVVCHDGMPACVRVLYRHWWAVAY